MGASAAACDHCCAEDGQGRGQLEAFGAHGADEVLPGQPLDALSERVGTPVLAREEPAASSRQGPPPRPGGLRTAGIGAAALKRQGSCESAPISPTPSEALFIKGMTYSEDADDESEGSLTNTNQDSCASTDAEVPETRLLVERFVRGLVRGTKMLAVTTTGMLVECLLTIDPAITKLSIQRTSARSGRKRDVPLAQIRKVCSGWDAGQDGEVALPLDDTCVALYLEDGQLLAFSLPEGEQRHAFVRCLSMFVGDSKVTLRPKRQRLSQASSQSAAQQQRQASGGPCKVGAVGGAAVEEDFGLEDPEWTSVPDVPEATSVPFQFKVEAEGGGA